jgi:RNA polymerase-binding transcription factor DksA
MPRRLDGNRDIVAAFSRTDFIGYHLGGKDQKIQEFEEFLKDFRKLFSNFKSKLIPRPQKPTANQFQNVKPIKDVLYWHNKIIKAPNNDKLRSVGEALKKYQEQTEHISEGVKRLSDDQLTLLREFYKDKAEKLATPKVSLNAPLLEDTEIAIVCIKCGLPIPVERLEAVPATKKCVKCQEKAESGEEQRPQASKCKRCGSVMVWRMTKNLRPTKYFLGCSNYPKCTYIGVSAF